MNNNTKLKTMIRHIIREEVAVAIQEVITELKQPTQIQQVSKPKQKKKIVEKQSFSKNSILNDVLNETAGGDEWKTLNGDTLTTNDMNKVAYGDLMSGEVNKNSMEVPSGDPMSKFLNKDYSGVLKSTDEKSKQKRGL